MAGGLGILTWGLAAAGGAAALAAAGGRLTGRLRPKLANALYMAAYGLMGASVALFVLRGLVESAGR